MAGPPRVIVVGAGIAGSMSALSLLRRGCRVTLIDRWEPGHGRAGSSDITRILRFTHGRSDLYTHWAQEARRCWMALQDELGCTLFVQCGVLVLAGKGQTEWEDATLSVFGKLGVSHARLEVDEIRARFPQFDCADVAYGIFESESGLLMARRAVVRTTELFVREGGALRRGRVCCDGSERPQLDGQPLDADLIVMAAGSWLGSLFPRTVGPISQVLRQDIVYTSAPDGETRYDAAEMPCWVDHGYGAHGAYGTPSVEGSGVKAGIVREGTSIDLDRDARVVSAATFEHTRSYLRHRLPGLAKERAVDQKACQTAMTPDTNFVIDFHPEHEHVLIAGGCSGHLFKHGPMFGEFVATVGLHERSTEPEFRLGIRGNLAVGDSPSGR